MDHPCLEGGPLHARTKKVEFKMKERVLALVLSPQYETRSGSFRECRVAEVPETNSFPHELPCTPCSLVTSWLMLSGRLLYSSSSSVPGPGLALEHGGMSDYVLRQAFLATEDGFLGLVQRKWQTSPQIAAVGSCCLVGAISGQTLYVASLGDSRAVLGSYGRNNGAIQAQQISIEHNASIESIRNELIANHPDDSHIVMLKHGVWRVKGIIQVSRSIGDVYLKKPEYNKEPLFQRFRLPEPLKKPVLTAEPTVTSRVLRAQDQFIIFASDGLWEHLSNQEAVELVHAHPRSGIARRLIKHALQVAAKKREMRYSDLKRIEKGIRRHFHDDITVVVVFLDHELLSRESNTPPVSIKAGVDSVNGANTPRDLFSTGGGVTTDDAPRS